MSNISVKNDILKVACKLFFNKGYKETSFDDIAKRCNVTKQAITYHFGTKVQLGRDVAQIQSSWLNSYFSESVKSKIGEVDNLTIAAAFIVWYAEYNKNCPNSFKFFQDFVMSDPNFESIIENVKDDYIKNFVDYGVSELEDAQIQLRSTEAFYAGKGLIYRYSIGAIKCGKEQFGKYLFLNYYTKFMYTIINHEVDNLYDRAIEVLDKADVAYVDFSEAIL